MSQVKIYGFKAYLADKKEKLSEVICHCIVEFLNFPKGKKAHQFINLEKDDFYYPKEEPMPILSLKY